MVLRLESDALIALTRTQMHGLQTAICTNPVLTAWLDTKQCFRNSVR